MISEIVNWQHLFKKEKKVVLTKEKLEKLISNARLDKSACDTENEQWYWRGAIDALEELLENVK